MLSHVSNCEGFLKNILLPVLTLVPIVKTIKYIIWTPSVDTDKFGFHKLIAL